MAKTIGQYAEEYFDKNFSRIGDMHIDDGIKTVFIESAKEQKERDVENACKAFCNHCGCTHSCAVRGIDCLWLEDFRKALEEE